MSDFDADVAWYAAAALIDANGSTELKPKKLGKLRFSLAEKLTPSANLLGPNLKSQRTCVDEAVPDIFWPTVMSALRLGDSTARGAIKEVLGCCRCVDEQPYNVKEEVAIINNNFFIWSPFIIRIDFKIYKVLNNTFG